MLVSSDSGLVDWLVVRFQTDVKHHDSTVVTADSDQCRCSGVEIDAHHTGLGSEGVFGPSGVLDGEAADHTTGLLQEIVRTVGDSEQILVFGVPAHGSDILAAGLVSREAPQGQHGAERLALRVVGGVLVVLVIRELLALSVLHDHALHDLQAAFH